MLIAAGHLCGGTQLCDVPLHQCLWRNYWSGRVAAWQAMYSHYSWLLWASSQPSYPQAHDPRRTQILPWQSTPRRQVIPDLPHIYMYIYLMHVSGDRSVCTVQFIPCNLLEIIHVTIWPTLDGGSRVQIPRNQFELLFEANWILELDPSALALGSSNHELSFLELFLFLLGLKVNWFSLQNGAMPGFATFWSWTLI
jgi:hypothetical protein